MHHGTRLRRAIGLAALSEMPRHSGTGEGGSRYCAGRQTADRRNRSRWGGRLSGFLVRGFRVHEVQGQPNAYEHRRMRYALTVRTQAFSAAF